MFKRRDIPPVLLLLLLIILVMLTLSQILVVHNGRYGKNVHNMRKLQLELREMDINLHSLMMQNVPSIELNRRLLQNEINAGRIAAIIAQAAKTHKSLPERGHRANDKNNRTRHTEQEHRSVLTDNRKPGQFQAKPDNKSLSMLLSKQRLPQESSLTPTPPSPHMPRFTKSSSLSHSRENPSHLLSSSPSAATLGSNQLHRALSFSLSNNSVVPVPTLKHNSSSTDPGSHSNGTSDISIINNLHSPQKVVMSRDDSPALSPRRHIVIAAPPNGANNELLVPRAGVLSNNPVLRKFASSSSFSSKLKKSVRINYCPSIPPNLKGRVFVNFDHKHNFTEGEIVRQNVHIQPGGMSRPKDCVARHRVAVVVPYRDRWDHLMILLSHLHPILERQQLDYRIFVVEQSGRDTFNKARIMNIAFVEALKQNNFQCFVFHDVDLVPEDDRNMYSCPTQPRHMSVAIDEMGYKLAYQELVGGVLNMRTEHFQRVNGYSNLYWGWGAEDDDMAYRIMHVGLKITRPPEGVARYKMVKHTKRKPADWRKRAKLLYTGTRRFQFDGLNSLQYKVVHIKKLPLFTHVLVDIGKPPRGF